MPIYKTLHLVYKIQSTFSNDFYIGRKTLKNLNQFKNYWSSSKKWKNFVLENGKNNFTKEILFEFDNEQEQVDKENWFNLDLYKNDLNCWSKGTFSVMIQKAMKERVENGSHHLLGGEMQRKTVENGTHPFLGGEIQRRNSQERVENKTHHLLGGEIQRASNKKRVEERSHHLLGKGRDDHPGKKTKGKVWVCNAERTTKIQPAQLEEYINNGYQRGRKYSE
jgi:hypothetical protein